MAVTSGAPGEKTRVLFTGFGVRMIENLMEHTSSQYQTQMCGAKDLDFARALRDFKPHVAVICLQNEQRDEMKAYYALEDDPEYLNLPVLVVGRDEDCELFRKKVTVRHAVILERPLNMELFLTTLDKMADEAMTLIRARAQAESASASAKTPAAPSGAGSQLRKSILVVDDDVRMLNVIKLYLQDMYEVAVVPSGKLALKYLAKKHADLVLLDYLMPEMDGPEVLEFIRTTTPSPQVPVLFLTGVSDKEMVMKTLEFHPDGYLLKPVTRDALLERVTEIMLDL